MKNLAYVDPVPSEKINGEIIMMSPRPVINHLRVIGNIYHIFTGYLKGKRCEAFADGADVHLDEKNTFVPDVMIVCNKDIIKDDGIYGAPDLVVEVLSPSTAKRDRGEKKSIYEKYGVKEYWIANPADKSIEVWLLKDGKYELDNVYTVYPDWQWEKMTDEDKAEAQLNLKVSLYDDLIIDVREIFDRV
jgi:Uma2 family endonuclease